MQQTITLNITQDDIDKGDKRNYFTDPISYALMREYGNNCKPWVNDYGISLNVNGRSCFYSHSDKAASFLKSFDNDQPVTPCTLEFYFVS